MKKELSLLERALLFAEKKHAGQKRKDLEGRDYIVHPLRVKELLSLVGRVDDEITLTAALLHDTLEDTETTVDELAGEFGVKISQIVKELTDDKSLDKELRKLTQIEVAKSLSKEASLIRISDKIANTEDVLFKSPINWDVSRRKKYIDWAAKVVDSLRFKNPELENAFLELKEKAEELLAE